jgi:periplasmic mercuric ion binding protein
MKRLIIFTSIIFSTLTVVAEQKDLATETHKVQGNCGMCEKRIENAAYIKGVKSADWNKETQELTIVYKPSKTTSKDILGAVAKAGHSSETVEVAEKDYNSLPKCCQYKTEKCAH